MFLPHSSLPRTIRSNIFYYQALVRHQAGKHFDLFFFVRSLTAESEKNKQLVSNFDMKMRKTTSLSLLLYVSYTYPVESNMLSLPGKKIPSKGGRFLFNSHLSQQGLKCNC